MWPDIYFSCYTFTCSHLADTFIQTAFQYSTVQIYISLSMWALLSQHFALLLELLQEHYIMENESLQWSEQTGLAPELTRAVRGIGGVGSIVLVAVS